MAAPPSGGRGLFFQPEPHEQAYYDGLFQAADVQRGGNIGGQQAVAFFSRSKLPMEQLKNVWTVADNPPSNSLDRQKFAVALRLIQLLQNGQKGQGSNLAAPPGVVLRPVFLDGISGTQVPMPQQPQSPPQQQRPPQQGGPPPAGGGYPQQQQRGGPPPPGSPPGGPQQPRAPQTPQSQQQQYQLPPAAGRPQVPPASTALTTQDPFSMTPNEQSRYDAIFPQYAKEDGFIHGKEAVELFSKSGLNHTQLRDIWNMVDHPVDNKLDKLEFAIAMHLIVCISKKNLPFPKILPMSLKGLKQQQQQPPPAAAAQATPASPRQQGQMHPSAIPPSPAASMQSHGMGMQQMPPPVPPIQQQPSSAESFTSAGLQGPPPLQSAMGGMDISDAFEGLNTGADAPAASGFGNEASHANNEPSHGMGGGFGAPSQDRLSPPAPKSPPKVKPVASFDNQSAAAAHSTMPEPAKTSHDLASSYNMADTSVELSKLKTVLQKLQAENISLKAQLGTMSEEEKDLQKEVHAVVNEIGDLSNHLTTLRAEVLAAKSRLLSATAELKAAQEKKGVLTDLISEAEATKTAIGTAYNGIEAAAQAAQAPAPAPAPMYEGDLFGFGDSAPAPAPQQAQQQHHAAPPQTQQQHHAAPQQAQYNHAAPAPFPVQMSQGQDQGGYHGAPKGGVETVSSDGSSSGDNFETNPDTGMEGSMHNDYGQDNEHPFRQNPGNTYGNNAPIISGLDEHMRNESNFGHQKQQNSISSNLSFDMGGPMGGVAAPMPANSQFSNNPNPVQISNDIGPAPSLDKINELKSKAKEAEDTAREAADTLRQLNARADELRTIADKAEADARQKEADAADPPKKKKGFMGVGGGGGGSKKKQSMKEALQAKQDAEAKKKEFLAIQSQANDAQAVAMETKREAEKLRKEAEQAEIAAASAASMQQSQPPAQPANAYQQQQQQQQQQQEKPPLGYGQQQNYGHPPPAQGYDSSMGFGSQPLGGGYGTGFNPNVMTGPNGGGGMMIPTPTGGGGAPDPYGNPFQ